MRLIINNKEIFFHVQYGKGKKFVLEATPEGLILVKVPSKTSEKEILEYMKSRSKELLAFMEQLENRKFISRQKTYTETENFLYQGKACHLSDLLEAIPETEEDAKRLLKKFYTAQTKEIVKQRVHHFEKIIGVKAKKVTIVDSHNSWGTCNSLKELTFNYRLSMSPLPVIDYVVVHELCHILHMNHDRSFWRKVGTFDSNYKNHEAYLTRFGGVMTL